MSAGRFAGRTALVTGGARGQGLAHGRRLADEGAVVFLADVLDDDGEEAAAALRRDGHDVTYLHLDVADVADWRSAASTVAEAHPSLDVLVNNAGIIRVVPIEQEDPVAWARVVQVNLTGAFLGMQSMLPLLRGSDSASVVNTSSIFGPSGAAGYSAYAASKAGLLGLTRTAALEFAPLGIRVNALVPGGVASAMNADEPDGGVVPETPLGRRADVAELAAAVAYLASDDASFVTGTELVVDGGFLAR